MVPFLHRALLPQGMQLLPALCGCLRHNNAAVRLAAARSVCGLMSGGVGSMYVCHWHVPTADPGCCWREIVSLTMHELSQHKLSARKRTCRSD